MRMLLLVLCVLLSACNLQSDVEPTSTSVVVIIPTATRQVATTTSPTSQPPTATATRQSATSIPPATVVNCIPRADWATLYTVVSGDTLGKIAQRVNSTAAALQQGNCIVDANQIVVGQVLRVPQAPLPPTQTIPTPTSTPQITKPFEIGGLGISSYIAADAGFFQLLRGSQVRLSWDGVPSGEIGNVTFAFMGAGWRDKFSNNFTALGFDNNPLDGIAFDWSVPAGLQNAELVAFAYQKNTGQLYHSLPLYVASTPESGQGCSISPEGANGVTAYMKPDVTSGISGTVKFGETVEVMGRSVGGWYAYLPELSYQTFAPVEMKVENLRWLPLDADYIFTGNCGQGQ
jgi:LysM repeat protein